MNYFLLQLEPGEIIRSNPSTKTKSSGEASAGSSSAPTFSPGDEHITVLNRKNGARLSGTKAPQLKNLPVWLEKNPDWDVEPKFADLVLTKGKLSEKLKSRIISGLATATVQSAAKSSGRSANSSSSNATSSSAHQGSTTATLSSVAANTAAASAAFQDPLLSLAVAAGIDPLQLPFLLSSFGNPMLAGMGGYNLPFMGFGGMGSNSIFGFGDLEGVSDSGSSSVAATTTSTTTSSSNTPGKHSDRSSKSDRRSHKHQPNSSTLTTPTTSTSASHSASSSSKTPSTAASTANSFASTQSDPLAVYAAANPFLFAAGNSAGIFGLSPFLAAASAGLMPGMNMNFPPTASYAAMAQLSALMGLQGLEGMMTSPANGSGTDLLGKSTGSLMSPTSQQQTPSGDKKKSGQKERKSANATMSAALGDSLKPSSFMSILETVSDAQQATTSQNSARSSHNSTPTVTQSRGKPASSSTKPSRIGGFTLNAVVSKLKENVVKKQPATETTTKVEDLDQQDKQFASVSPSVLQMEEDKIESNPNDSDEPPTRQQLEVDDTVEETVRPASGTVHGDVGDAAELQEIHSNPTPEPVVAESNTEESEKNEPAESV